MPSTSLFTFLLLFSATSADDYSPFLNPLTRPTFELGLFRRADKCATSCADMGANVCCGKKAACALDQAGNVACCPNNALCTGTIAGGAAPTKPPSAAPLTAAPGAAISHAISGTSTLSNQYYPFPVLPTTYANAADCSTSFSSCQAESAKCTGFVEGGGYGVTVAGQKGQITQQAAMPVQSAESICSSLSQEACHGLQLAQCSTLGGGASSGGGTFEMGESSNAGAAPTRCRIMYGMGVGAAVGLAGQII